MPGAETLDRERQQLVEVRDAAAVEELYSSYSSRVYRFCLHELGSREEAEDTLQETYLNAWTSLRRGVRPDSPLPWLLRIAKNLCISRYRARAARVRTQTLDEAEIVAVGPDPARDELFALSEALAELPEIQRRAFVLREWRGLSYQEVAAELGLSCSAVGTHLFRGRRALAAALDHELRPPARQRLRSLGLVPLLAGLKSLFAGGASVKVGTGLAVLATIGVTVAPSLEPPPPAPPPPLEQLASGRVAAPPDVTQVTVDAEVRTAETTRVESRSLRAREFPDHASVGIAIAMPAHSVAVSSQVETVGELSGDTAEPEPSGISHPQGNGRDDDGGLALGHGEEQGHGKGQSNGNENGQSNGAGVAAGHDSGQGKGNGKANGQGNGNTNGQGNGNATGQEHRHEQSNAGGPGDGNAANQGNADGQANDVSRGPGNESANGQGHSNASGQGHSNASGQGNGHGQENANGAGGDTGNGNGQGNPGVAGHGNAGGNGGGAGSGQGSKPKK